MIRCAYIAEPNWPADPARPRFQKAYGGVDYWVETDGVEPTAQELDAFFSPPAPPFRLPTKVIEQRLTAIGKWDDYVNYMFGTNARRNAFLRIMFIGEPVLVGNGLTTTLSGAGLTAQEIATVTAPL